MKKLLVYEIYGHFYFRLLFLPVLIILNSCTTISDSLYVQNVDVKGPINQPPIRVTEKDQAPFTISPKVFINSNNKDFDGFIEGHTNVNSDGNFQVDTIRNGDGTSYQISQGINMYEYEGENLHWQIPNYMVGLDLDISLSKKIALTGGFNLASSDKTNLYGYRVGLGFFSTSENFGVRFDGGIIWQKYTYDAASVIIREKHPDFSSSTSEVIFFRDRGKSTNLNHYLSLTINTIYEKLPVNFLVNFGYSGQSLIDYEPETPDEDYYFLDPYYRVEDMRGEAYAAFFNISPGIFMRLTEWSRLVFSVRFFSEINFEESQSSSFIIPMVQFDLSL